MPSIKTPVQWSPVSDPSGAWYSALGVGLATPILWQARKEEPGGLSYTLQVPNLWVRKAVALHGHHTSTIILAPHQPAGEAEQERGGREEKTPREAVSLGHWNCEDLGWRLQITSFSQAKPISTASKLLVVWVLLNQKNYLILCLQTLNCPVEKVRWMKSIASDFAGFWRFDWFFSIMEIFFNWVFSIMVCYSEALLVKTGLVDVPQFWGLSVEEYI